MRVALYARFSSDNQRTVASSINTAIVKHGLREGWQIVERYEDKAISGSTAERPAILAAGCEGQTVDVLVDDFSRLSCDQVTEQVRRRFVHWGVRLIGVSDGIDTSAKGHKMLSSMKGMMNEVFLDDLSEKTHRGMVGQVLKGYHCGGRCFGYRLVPELDPSKKDPYGQPARIGTRLEKDEEQAHWVGGSEQYADGM
jgi:DNA invertase Pin-like site-specific DNA recombinase